MKTKILVLVASLALSLAGAEVAFRFLGQSWVYTYPPVCPRPELFRPNDSYGYAMWPSHSIRYSYPREQPRSLSLVSNSDGFRSRREFHEPDARTRVIVLGDSFVFGEGVEESERFTDVLESMEPRWRVDNLGMTGYGLDLMYRALDAVGVNLNPDVVVVAIYTDDFRRVYPSYAGAGFPIPRFQLQAGELVTVPYPTPGLWGHSRLLQALRYLYWGHTNALFDLNAAILDRFLRLAEQHHFAPGIIFLPGRQDTPDDEQRRNWLANYAKRHSVPFLDLTTPLRNAGTEQVFIPKNWHLNPRGHAVVASELAHFLAPHLERDRYKSSHSGVVGGLG